MSRQTATNAVGVLAPHQNQLPFISWSGRNSTGTPAARSSVSPSATLSSSARQRPPTAVAGLARSAKLVSGARNALATLPAVGEWTLTLARPPCCHHEVSAALQL